MTDQWLPERIAEILEVVGAHFGLGRAEILARCRSKTIARARIVAVRLAREEGYSFPELGRAFGNRDHTTIMSNCRRVASACVDTRIDPLLADDYFACMRAWAVRREQLHPALSSPGVTRIVRAAVGEVEIPGMVGT